MPELPEVEVITRGIKPYLENQLIKKVTVRNRKLRWPVPDELEKNLKNSEIESITRRAKFVLIKTSKGIVMIHLGMSGSLRVLKKQVLIEKHDHIDLELSNHFILRFRDPRRFGCFLWTQNMNEHPLLRHLGPEPLSRQFNATYLHTQAKNRKISVKLLIMNNQIVVGVGNIYAAEALYDAGIHPLKKARALTVSDCQKLTLSIKKILKRAIKKGGTSLKDFVDSDGNPGNFSLHLKVYGRSGLPCESCGTKLKQIKIGQRSTVYCLRCQSN